MPSSRKIAELRAFAKSWRRLDFSHLYERRTASWKAWLSRGKEGKPPSIRANNDRGRSCSTPIPIHNYAAVYELAGGCFFQDLNGGWSSPVPANAEATEGPLNFATAIGMMLGGGMNDGGPHPWFPAEGNLFGIGAPLPLQPGVLPPLLQQAQAYAQENGNANGTEPHVFVNINPPEDGNGMGGSMIRRRLRTSTLAWLALPSRRDLDFDTEGTSSSGDSGVYPSQSSQVAEISTFKPQWYTAPFDFRIADICLDVERDLLVVVEREDIHDL